MIEITLISNKKKIFSRPSGERVVFEKDRTRYFADDDPIARKILQLSDEERVKVFESNEDIKQYPLAEGWEHFSPNRLKEILETLGVETAQLKRQPDFVKRVEQAIEDGLIVVREGGENAVDNETAPEVVKLQQENEALRSEMHSLKVKHGKQRKAFEETVADLITRIEELEGKNTSKKKQSKQED